MKFEVACYTVVNGMAWPVTVQMEMQSKKPGEVKKIMALYINKLMAIGLRPFPMPLDGCPPNRDDGGMPVALAEGGLNPLCPTHEEPMKHSTVQKKEGVTAYFCPKKSGNDYCHYRASVNGNTGELKVWEMKK